jgi:hypothetical protein
MFIALCSKDSYSFNHKNFPKLDKNTIRKVGAIEDEIPHFFVDFNDIFELFINFDIDNTRHINDCFFDGKKQ